MEEVKTEQKPVVEKKVRKAKKLTRKALLVQKFNEGVTDPVKLAELLEEAVNSGQLIIRNSNRKHEPNKQLYFAQVKWYLHQAREEGLIQGEISFRRTKKKEKVEAAPVAAEAVEAPAAEVAAPAEETLGTL